MEKDRASGNFTTDIVKDKAKRRDFVYINSRRSAKDRMRVFQQIFYRLAKVERILIERKFLTAA